MFTRTCLLDLILPILLDACQSPLYLPNLCAGSQSDLHNRVVLTDRSCLALIDDPVVPPTYDIHVLGLAAVFHGECQVIAVGVPVLAGGQCACINEDASIVEYPFFRGQSGRQACVLYRISVLCGGMGRAVSS